MVACFAKKRIQIHHGVLSGKPSESPSVTKGILRDVPTKGRVYICSTAFSYSVEIKRIEYFKSKSLTAEKASCLSVWNFELMVLQMS